MPATLKRPALVQDWHAGEAGAERVAVELAKLLPTADIYTSFYDPSVVGGALRDRHVHAWPAQRLVNPRHFRSFLPLYPLYFSTLDLRRYPLVVSGSVAFSHAVRTSPSATHISYVYTPIRYAWDLDAYLEQSSWGLAARLGGRVLRPVLKRWDRATASRPDYLVAISEEVRRRIARVWNRDAQVIYPPVDITEIPMSTLDDGYLLIAARMLAYRRIDLAVQAATLLGRQLVVVGNGPENGRLRALAGPTVRFLGIVDRRSLLGLFARCHAYLVPGVEDFGIAPVEAMAAGKPVIGFERGGVAETVVPARTGVLFSEQTVESLSDAIELADGMHFEPAVIRARAEEFAAPVFRRKWRMLFEHLGLEPSLYSPR